MDSNVLTDGESEFSPPSENQSLKLKKPMYLEEIRHEDPQGAIDYIYGRKEKWKKAAKHLFTEAKVAKEKAETYRKRSVQWKKRFERELTMRQWWKFATFATGLCSFTVTVVMVCITLIFTTAGRSSSDDRQPPQFMTPTSGRIQQTPNHVLASVIIYNGDLQGSGTIISRGKEKAALLSAGHNFKEEEVGDKFWIYYADGTYAEAVLVAIDKKRDLALATVEADSIITHAFVPKEFPDPESSLTSVGFTNGKGPIFKTLKYNKQFRDSRTGKYVWELSLRSGEYWNGDSGGGVFLGNALSAVATHRNYSAGYCYNGTWVQDRVKMYAAPHHEIVSFLEENQDKIEGCGDWCQEPEALPVALEDGPPLWMPQPNVPIHLPIDSVARNDSNDGRPTPPAPDTRIRPSDVPDPANAIRPQYK